MSDDIERAKDGIEDAHHHAETYGDAGAKMVAMLIAALAAALAIADLGEKSAQNLYLTHHIAASDDWAFYQAKLIRSNLLAETALLLDSLPNAADPDIRKRAEAARVEAARLDDDEATQGRKQLAARAREREAARDEAFHRHHRLELVVGALQIAIVLASISIVVRIRAMAVVAGIIGGGASVAGLLVAAGVL
jgi:hypothetical protein